MDSRFLAKIGKQKDLFGLYKVDLPLNLRLYVLKMYFSEIYTKIVNMYKEFFNFIEKVEIIDSKDLPSVEMLGMGPVFCVKERNVKREIRLDELSSGMQKALLIITDLYALPEGSIYFIDEYENSLGVGAINTLPDALLSDEFGI